MANYMLIRGTFHVAGFSPDGDSMMFKAEKEQLWKQLGNVKKEEKNGGAVQLRLQGIDALETHYCPEMLVAKDPELLAKEKNKKLGSKPIGNSRQTSELARRASNRFMEILGAQKPDWKPVYDGSYVDSVTTKDGKVARSKKDPVSSKRILVDKFEGYIVASGIDSKGRPLVWAFAGKPNKESLEEKDLIKCVDESANYILLKEGLAYPYFFNTLNEGLREELKKVAQKAAKNGSGVWKDDKTTRGIRNSTVKEIQEAVIFPDLFRKIIKGWYSQNVNLYWMALGSLKKYDAIMEQNVIDLKKIIGNDETKKPGPMFEVKKDGTLRMIMDPWAAVFKS